MTPYQIHQTLNHHVSRHSPNAVDIIEECQECGQRWLHNPSIGYPVTMPVIDLGKRCNCGHLESEHTRVFTYKGCAIDICACDDFEARQ